MTRLIAPVPETIFWGIAALCAVGLIVTFAISLSDTRTIDGYISVWAKPMKFEASLALHALTLALVASQLSEPQRNSFLMHLIAGAFLLACLAEMGWIISQAARQETSHFNVSTPLHRLMWSVMAIAAVVIIGAAGATGFVILLDRDADMAPALRLAIVLGLVGGTILTLVTAFTIGERMSPYIGERPLPETRMPITGWSRNGGDLRVSHFLATHMIQFIPLAGLALSVVFNRPTAMIGVVAFTIFWGAWTILEYRHSLDGKASVLASLF
jgi:hypothetical protein